MVGKASKSKYNFFIDSMDFQICQMQVFCGLSLTLEMTQTLDLIW